MGFLAFQKKEVWHRPISFPQHTTGPLLSEPCTKHRVAVHPFLMHEISCRFARSLCVFPWRQWLWPNHEIWLDNAGETMTCQNCWSLLSDWNNSQYFTQKPLLKSEKEELKLIYKREHRELSHWQAVGVKLCGTTAWDRFYWDKNVLQFRSTKTVSGLFAREADVDFFFYWWKCRLQLLFPVFVGQWLRERSLSSIGTKWSQIRNMMVGFYLGFIYAKGYSQLI